MKADIWCKYCEHHSYSRDGGSEWDRCWQPLEYPIREDIQGSIDKSRYLGLCREIRDTKQCKPEIIRFAKCKRFFSLQVGP